MYFDVDYPQLFAETLAADPEGVASLVGGYLRSRGANITKENELVLDMKEIAKKKKDIAGFMIYVRDDQEKLRKMFPLLNERGIID